MGCEDSECRGCTAYIEYHCTLPPIRQEIECPCLNCIVKGVCINDCEEIFKYANKTETINQVQESNQ